MELDFTSDTVEKLLFKKALADKNWMNILANVYDKRWFKTKSMQGLIESSLKFFAKYRQAPTIPVLQAMAKKYAESHAQDGFSLSDANNLILEMSNMDNFVSDDVLQKNIKEFIRKNTLNSTLMDNIDILSMMDEERDADKCQKLVDKVLENFDKVQKLTFNDSDLGLDYFSEKGMDSHWEFLRNPDAKIHTGWRSIDDYTNGGFLKDGRMLGLFMAQAGLGKSVFLSNLAVNFLKQNLSVVVISLEMSQDVYAQRFDAHISHKNINHLCEEEKTAKERIRDFYKQYPQSNLIIKEYPPRSISSNVIDAYLEQLKAAGKKIDVLIVDYLNLVIPNKQSDSMFKDGLSVSEELRALSYKYCVPVITAAQCNSEGMNSEDIDMQNVSESRGIVHTVDCMFALYQTKEQLSEGKIGLKVIKNRLGGMVGKKSAFKMDPATLVLEDMTYGGDDIEQPEEESELSRITSAFKNITTQPFDDVSGL